jgi:hypothetical protein
LHARAINFVQDFPDFAVLLCILQRFDRRAWGQHDAFRLKDGESPWNGEGDYELCMRSLNKQKLNFSLTPSEAKMAVHLLGRGTSVCGITSTDDNPLGSGSLAGVDMVIKVSRPEVRRRSEVDMIQFALDAASQGDSFAFPDELGIPPRKHVIRGHLPVVIASLEVPEPLTSVFGSARGTRCLRLIVALKLHKIRELTQIEFVQAFLDCFLCSSYPTLRSFSMLIGLDKGHRKLWMAGVQHRDISLNNLMYYRADDGQVHGVLNDFDLAILRDEGEREVGTDRTGTWPFMAIDLLEDLSGEVVHSYGLS